MTERTDSNGQVHAMLSASGASRWLACTPSARMEELYAPPVGDPSPYAAEGILAHTVAAIVAMEMLKRPNIPAMPEGVDEDMIAHATAYAKIIKARSRLATIVGLEERVDFSEWAPGGFGTCDCFVVKRRLLEIIDYKYGRGILVSAVDNSQLRLYALGLLSRYNKITRVRLTIYQPRISPEPCTTDLSVAELLAWANAWVKPRAMLAYQGEGDFAPSYDNCRFCSAKEACWARQAANVAILSESPATTAEAAMLLKHTRDLKKWEEDLKERVKTAILAGEVVSGWKLVDGRKEGSLLLVPESDRRPAFQTERSVIAAFDENPEEE